MLKQASFVAMKALNMSNPSCESVSFLFVSMVVSFLEAASLLREE
jgi:hypothetical protein